ncbi:MAG: DUF350 domain-containing protein [Myxococcales bacterium]|nr:DUF350 domain-containing protein [Myxococcales bacterium]
MSSELTMTLFQMGKSLLWALTAAVSFAFSMGLAIKVFDWMSKDINEWEEIRKGNLGVALIFVAMILSVGLVLYKVL